MLKTHSVKYYLTSSYSFYLHIYCNITFTSSKGKSSIFVFLLSPIPAFLPISFHIFFSLLSVFSPSLSIRPSLLSPPFLLLAFSPSLPYRRSSRGHPIPFLSPPSIVLLSSSVKPEPCAFRSTFPPPLIPCHPYPSSSFHIILSPSLISFHSYPIHPPIPGHPFPALSSPSHVTPSPSPSLFPHSTSPLPLPLIRCQPLPPTSPRLAMRCPRRRSAPT